MEDSEPSGIVVDPGSGVTSRASVVSTGSAECDTRAAERGEEQGDYRDRVASADDLSAPSSGGEGAGCDVHRARGGHSSQGGGGERGGRGAKGNKDLSKRPTRGKVWGVDEIIFLIKAWKVASLLRLPDGQTAKQAAAADFSVYISHLLALKFEIAGLELEDAGEYLAGIVYAPPKPEGGLAVADPNFRPISQRALEDKMASLRSSFTLISDPNNGTLVDSTGRPEWYSISKSERAEILQKWGRVALSFDCFTALGGIFEDDPNIDPINGGIQLGLVENSIVESPPREN
ncbi:hypothetical protein PF011_g259 [Phytophthora fragariae]|uniref:Uncharacterized protein n=1 Tax=Phytophthora fragariae TaxID=53985 RepID=A0A6A3MHZ4_9STRA|nr:hypothetical protein PF011_g259 [Phytophthora fragariae]